MNEDENAIWRGFEARLERIEDIVRDLDEVLRGDRRKQIIGLLPEYDRLDAEIRKLNAVVFVDSTGKRGIAHDVDYLMDRRSGQEKRSQLQWGFWAAVIAALISSAATLATNWDQVKAMFPMEHPGPLERKIEKARHPKSSKKLYRYHIVPAPSEAGIETEPKTPPKPEPPPK